MRSSESRPKRENDGAGIYQLVMSFDGKTYKSGNYFLMREKKSKYETASFMKLATYIMFTQMFGDKLVASMVKEYRKIEKVTMEGKPVITPIDQDMLSYKDKSKALEAVNLIIENRNGKIMGRTVR